jgi:hypothetical protein
MRRTSSLTPQYVWDDRAARYASKQTGRWVSGGRVRGALDAALDRGGATVATLTESLKMGRIALPDWQLQVAREIKSIHLASAALAKGGWAEMSPSDLGRAGQKIRLQYDYLKGFAADISSGKQRLDGTLGRRAQLYVQAGRGTYHAVEQAEMRTRGMTEERNRLAASDHCPGCLAADAMGWVPLGTLPGIGQRTCLSKCRCSVAYR